MKLINDKSKWSVCRSIFLKLYWSISEICTFHICVHFLLPISVRMDFLPMSIETKDKPLTEYIEVSFSVIITTLTQVNDIIFCHWTTTTTKSVYSYIRCVPIYNLKYWLLKALLRSKQKRLSLPSPICTHTISYTSYLPPREKDHISTPPMLREYFRIFLKNSWPHTYILLLQKASLVFLWYLLLGNLIQNYN